MPYLVVHFILTAEAAAEELPAVFKGQLPEPRSSSIGTGNVALIPKAVVLGGAYTDEDFALMHQAVSSQDQARAVVWLRQDSSKPAPPLGPEYGKAMVARVKETLVVLEKDGKLDGHVGGTYWY